jgi:Caspase domain
MTRIALVTVALLVTSAGPGAVAQSADPQPPRASFALIIGVNASPFPDVAPLRYADDDAARYLDLFRALGARTYVLSRLDDNTRRLHPQAAAEAALPRRAELRQAVESLSRDVAQARARGVRSTLYVIYAGHGDADGDHWFLTLEDERLSGAQLLSDVVDRAGADQTHVIVDACHAYLLALPRGPGGTRRPVAGFVELEAASRAGKIGFLLASSVSGESHEWAGFEAGVFSHEVRSGLYGAADADGNGQVTYTEMAAFVSRANQAITNERFRPQVLARAPRDGDLLLDLRPARDHELRWNGKDLDAHYLLEDSAGVRLLDFHGAATTPVHLIRPTGEGPLYLRRLADGSEWTIPRRDGVVQIDRLSPSASRVGSRGAAHHAFSQIFALSFDGAVVTEWREEDADVRVRLAEAEDQRSAALERKHLRKVVGVSAIVVGAAAAVSAGALEIWAYQLEHGAPPGESQRDAFARNDAIATRNHIALGLAAGAAGCAGAALWLLWPRVEGVASTVDVALGPAGGYVGAHWHF